MGPWVAFAVRRHTVQGDAADSLKHIMAEPTPALMNPGQPTVTPRRPSYATHQYGGNTE
jgi:hypothetical protein